MAVQAKYSSARGTRSGAITVASGDVVGTDTITVNFDITNMTERDAIEGLDQVKKRIMEGKWPPL